MVYNQKINNFTNKTVFVIDNSFKKHTQKQLLVFTLHPKNDWFDSDLIKKIKKSKMANIEEYKRNCGLLVNQNDNLHICFN